MQVAVELGAVLSHTLHLSKRCLKGSHRSPSRCACIKTAKIHYLLSENQGYLPLLQLTEIKARYFIERALCYVGECQVPVKLCGLCRNSLMV